MNFRERFARTVPLVYHSFSSLSTDFGNSFLKFCDFFVKDICVPTKFGNLLLIWRMFRLLVTPFSFLRIWKRPT